jgi:hypothetical protein
MLERATARTLPLVNRASEYAPVAPACCNICRTCTATNVVGLVLGAVVAAGAAIGRFVQPRQSGIRLPR